LELWRFDPFAAGIRDGRIWARGAGDNKGNLMARIAAVKAHREVHGRLPPGVGHPVANIHAPNEKIFVEDAIQTIKGIGLLMAEDGRRVSGSPEALR
jgi:acetylornithine deacetylase/succinyl-diaminopimelate desuccinylase-like protein